MAKEDKMCNPSASDKKFWLKYLICWYFLFFLVSTWIKLSQEWTLKLDKNLNLDWVICRYKQFPECYGFKVIYNLIVFNSSDASSLGQSWSRENIFRKETKQKKETKKKKPSSAHGAVTSPAPPWMKTWRLPWSWDAGEEAGVCPLSTLSLW